MNGQNGHLSHSYRLSSSISACLQYKLPHFPHRSCLSDFEENHTCIPTFLALDSSLAVWVPSISNARPKFFSRPARSIFTGTVPPAQWLLFFCWAYFCGSSTAPLRWVCYSLADQFGCLFVNGNFQFSIFTSWNCHPPLVLSAKPLMLSESMIVLPINAPCYHPTSPLPLIDVQMLNCDASGAVHPKVMI